MNQDTPTSPEKNPTNPPHATTRIVRVARLFGQTPVAVLVHTEDGRRQKISLPEWDHINPDTGNLTDAGWRFVEAELSRVFGAIEWSLFGAKSR